MGGLGNVFKRILPLIMLICTLCLGLTHIFQKPNLTYLHEENITSQVTNETIQYYRFDTNAYMNNLSADLFKDSLDITNSFERYKATLNSFQVIWENGYQLFDVTKTIANANILILNTLLLPINILLIPLRISSAILLTTFSIIGINIAISTGIIKFLKDIVKYAEIPLIKPWIEGEEETTELPQVNGSVWRMYDDPFTGVTNKEIKFDFYVNSYNNQSYELYHGMKIEYNLPLSSNGFKQTWNLYYLNNNNEWIKVCSKVKGLLYEDVTWETGNWVQEGSRYQGIVIADNNSFNELDWINLVTTLNTMAGDFGLSLGYGIYEDI